MTGNSTQASEQNAPLISVIMASYNYERYLAEAIESVQRQTCGHWELLLVDDGSTDASWSIIERFAASDARIRPLFHENHANRGLPETIRLGLDKARGEYVAFLESDDMWHERCLEKRLSRLAQTGAGVVFNHVELLAMPGASVDGYTILVNAPRDAYGNIQGAFSPKRTLLIRNIVPTFSCAMARKSAFTQCDFSTPVPRWLDWWLWMQIARTESFAYLPEALGIWRIHSTSYNSKVSFGQYMDDNRAMWHGFRRLYRHGKGYANFAFLLRMPSWIRLCARMFNILRTDGAGGLATRVRRRIRG